MNTLVTCATSAIGSSLLQHPELATDQLIITGRDSNKLTDLGNKHKATAIELDFFQQSSIDQAAAHIPIVDKLVFIIPRIHATTDVFPDESAWLDLFEKYFVLPLSLIKQLHQQHKLNHGCKIVLVSGLSSKHALSNYAMSNTLRLAWLGQAKSLALYLAKDKISVNTLSMGGVLTESYINKLKRKAKDLGRNFEQQMALEVDNIPLRQYAHIETVCHSIVNLLGPMSDHMTGQNILLDGGFVKSY